MRRVGAALLVLAVLVVPVAPAGAAEPVEFPLVVTPSTSLTNGQVVDLDSAVTGGVFAVYQCVHTAIAETLATGMGDCVRNVVAPITTVIPPATAAVQRFVESDDDVVDCALVSCSLLLVGLRPIGPGPFPLELESYAIAPLVFTPSRLVIVEPGTGLVTASPLAAPAVSAAFVMRCAFLVSGGVICGEPGTVEGPFDGTFHGAVETDAEITVGGAVADCRVDACGVAVVVLGAGPTIIDIAGAGDPNY